MAKRPHLVPNEPCEFPDAQWVQPEGDGRDLVAPGQWLNFRLIHRDGPTTTRQFTPAKLAAKLTGQDS